MAKGNPFKAKGRIGNLVFYNLKGEDLIRVIPANVHNPNTTAQSNHRTKVKLASKFLKTMNEFIKIGYQATSADYPANEARQYLIKNCFNITPAGPVLDYKKVLIARGDIPAPLEYKMSVEANSASISWKTSTRDTVKRQDDRAMVAMFMEDGEKSTSELMHTPAHRRDGSVTVTIPSHTVPAQIWMFFYNAEEEVGKSRKNISDSVWLGEIPVK